MRQAGYADKMNPVRDGPVRDQKAGRDKVNKAMGTKRILVVAATAIWAAAGATTVWAQNNAQLHGHVQNAVGQALKSGDVKLTADKTAAPKDRTYKYDFPLTATGDYTGKDIAPGEYIAVVFAEGKSVDFQDVTLKTSDDKTLDFDMTRAEYLKAMTPEERNAIEEFKKKNAAVSADNAKIANINKTLLQALDDEKNGKAEAAVQSLQPLTEASRMSR